MKLIGGSVANLNVDLDFERVKRPPVSSILLDEGPRLIDRRLAPRVTGVKSWMTSL